MNEFKAFLFLDDFYCHRDSAGRCNQSAVKGFAVFDGRIGANKINPCCNETDYFILINKINIKAMGAMHNNRISCQLNTLIATPAVSAAMACKLKTKPSLKA